jgi:hypothetical protein
VLLLLSASIGAQPYLDATSRWQFVGGGSDFSGHYSRFETKFYFDGDTTINSQLYRKLYYDIIDTTFSFATGAITSIDTTEHGYYAAIREAGQRLYWTPFFDSQEELLADYDLAVGDTVSWINCFQGPVIVTAIDTVYLGASPLRRFFMNDISWAFVLEGAGTTQGFRMQCPNSIPIDYSNSPVCYSRGGDFVPMQIGIADCSFALSAVDAAVPQPLHCWPNPVSGIAQLELPGGAPVQTATLSDGRGRSFAVAVNARGQVDLHAFPAGIYWLRVVVDRKLLVAQLVKI